MVRGESLANTLRTWRERANYSQLALASRAGVSRQALIAIERGRQVPSAALALRLASVLGCAVEDLFSLPNTTRTETVAVPLDAGPVLGGRVVVGSVDGRHVAHTIGQQMALSADAIVVATAPPPPGAAAGSARVELLQEARRIEDGVLIAGCAPLIATFAHRASGRLPQARVTWIPANSAQALALLAAGLVHAAGVHAPGANTPEQTCTLVRRQFPHQGMLVANFTRWRQGLVVAPGNPYGLRTVADLAGRRLRYAQREKGAAARLLSDELFTAAGLPVAKRPQGPTADNHWDVAEQVRWGAADAGIAIESVARLTQLGFVPLVSERFDLIVPTARAGLPQVRALFELLEDPAFRADAARIPGYDCTQAGDVIRIEGA